MDGRPASATIVPFLALAAVLVAAALVVGAQAAVGRPQLVERARDWAVALSHGDIGGAEQYISTPALRDRAAMARWEQRSGQLQGTPLRLRRVKILGAAAEVTYLALGFPGRNFDREPVTREVKEKWGRGADGVWYFEP